MFSDFPIHHRRPATLQDHPNDVLATPKLGQVEKVA